MTDEGGGGPHRADRPSSSSRSIAIVLLVVLGTLLRAAPIGDRPVSLDEAQTWRTAGLAGLGVLAASQGGRRWRAMA
ncbi:MAG: hypothetical protein ACREK2_09625, partial [Gemmatimonadota bacterium]